MSNDEMNDWDDNNGNNDNDDHIIQIIQSLKCTWQWRLLLLWFMPRCNSRATSDTDLSDSLDKNQAGSTKFPSKFQVVEHIRLSAELPSTSSEWVEEACLAPSPHMDKKGGLWPAPSQTWVAHDLETGP